MPFDLILRTTSQSQASITSSLNSLISSNTFSDTNVICSDGVVQTNRLILWLAFPFLKNADVFNMIFAEHVLIVPDISRSIFERIINSSGTETMDETDVDDNFLKIETEEYSEIAPHAESSIEKKFSNNKYKTKSRKLNKRYDVDIDDFAVCQNMPSNITVSRMITNKENNTQTNKTEKPEDNFLVVKDKLEEEKHFFRNDVNFDVTYIDSEHEIVDYGNEVSDYNDGDVVYIILSQTSKPKIDKNIFNWGVAISSRRGRLTYKCSGIYQCEECGNNFKNLTDCDACKKPLVLRNCKAKKSLWICEGNCRRRDFGDCCQIKKRKLVIMYRYRHGCL